MLEDSPTYGSIESSESVRRQLADQSLVFNAVKTDEWFHHLFPDIWAICQQKVDNDVAKKEATREERGRVFKVEIRDNAGNDAAALAAAEQRDCCERAECGCLHSDVFLIPLTIIFCLLFFLVLAIAVVVAMS